MAFVGIDRYLINPNNIIYVTSPEKDIRDKWMFQIVFIDEPRVGIFRDTIEEIEKVYEDFVDKLAISQVM